MYSLKATSLVFAALLALTLQSCGGGSDSTPENNTSTNGDSSENSAPLSISASNSKMVARYAVSVLDLGSETSDSSQALRAGTTGKNNGSARVSHSFACEHGGTQAFETGDNDNIAEVGDFLEFRNDQCGRTEENEETGVSYVKTTSGFYRMEVAHVTSQEDVESKITLDLSSSTSDGHTSSTKGGGSVRFIATPGNDGLQVTSDLRMTGTFDDKTLTYDPLTSDYVLSGNQYTHSYNAQLSGSAIGGSIKIVTDPALTGTIDDESENTYPTAGKIIVTGSNSSVVLDADTGNPATVLLTIDDNGAVSSEEINWSELEGQKLNLQQ